MSFFVPDAVRESALVSEEGRRWLEQLPARVAALERAWSLAAGPVMETNASCSWVAPVRLGDGSEAVLKVGLPHREARWEAAALRVYDGRGAVRLLRASEDGFTLLLERCVPGNDLWSLGEAEANAAGAGVLRALWREAPAEVGFEQLTDMVAEWCESLPREAPASGYDPEIIADAVALGRELAASQPRQVLVHGDFHPGNVLAAERAPWLAIDCKSVVGDPAYDLAQWLGNRAEAAEQSPDPVAAIRWQADQMSDLLELDPSRVAGWLFVKSLGWDWGPASARLMRAVLERVEKR